jgi:FAD/FMN-containing dehydrogenase
MMQSLLENLCVVLGNENVITDALECEYFAQDVYSKSSSVAAVVAPADKNELAATVRLATESGIAVIARGGGMSYTGGYVPAEENAILVDTSRMNRIVEINPEDMYVTVEAGITWAALYEALKDTGLRTPYWGTLSGLYATVGGSLSQNSIFFGSGRYGTAADSVLSMEVVLADGTILNTGSAAQINASPFFRHHGPDLTGLFTSDCGALGLKATATFLLIPEQAAQSFASFAFENQAGVMKAMSEISRHDLATECFGFDPYLQQQRMKRDSLASDVKKLGGVLKAAGGVGKAIKAGAKMAVAGRGFMDDVKWSFHVMIEARTEASAIANLQRIREISARYDGRELADSIPRLVRANPFGPVNNMLGPGGERWVPVHALVPHSKAIETLERVEALFSEHKDDLEKYEIHTGYLLATVSTNCFVIEPVFFWPDELMEIHRRSVEPAHLKLLKINPENLPARETVAKIRGQLTELFKNLGSVHLQLGKSYRYREGLQSETFALVQSIKKIVDPGNRINPGNLGL